MTTVLRAQGFNCPSCVSKIENKLRRLSGVNEATVHFATGRIVVEHQTEVTATQLIAAVAAAGYTAQEA